jgi:hypothetical protein
LSTDCPAADQFAYGPIGEEAPLADIPSTANSQDHLPFEFDIDPYSRLDPGIFDSFSDLFDNFGDTPHITELQDNNLASLTPIPSQDPISSDPNSNASTTSRSTSTSSPSHRGHAKRQKLSHIHAALPLPIRCGHEGCTKQFDRECDYKYVLSQRVRALTNYISRHSKTHNRDFKCSYDRCDHQAYRQADIDRHFEQVHLGRRPNTCTACGRGFGRQDDLRRHVEGRTHIRRYGRVDIPRQRIPHSARS